jgi:ComF family protein
VAQSACLIESLRLRCKNTNHIYCFADCISALDYHAHNVSQSIISFKFFRRPEAAKVLAGYMAKIFNQYYSDIPFDHIQAVPVSPIRRKDRGYDQSYLLAQELCVLLNRPPPADLLKKVVHNKEQHLLGAEKRWKNVQNVYAPIDEYEIKDKMILLVDDIITTGATLDECAKVLLKSGARQVYCITLASAV